MGCFQTKHRKIHTLPTLSAGKLDDLKILPSTFVKINPHSFSTVYTSGRLLGSGAFGEVRFCTHKKSSARRAVKVYKKSDLPDDINKNRLLEEIEILKLLDHPSIVRSYEFFEDSEFFYIVMEHCKGGELFDEICKKKIFKEPDAAEIMGQLFSCLAYMHEKGVVHRDLKPENILLDERSDLFNIKLIDFGSAVFFRAGESLREALGTPYYIAPEVIRENYSEKCDVWSAGVIMYILLAGFPPFDGANETEILKKIKEWNWNNTAPGWKKLSAEARDLITRIFVPENERLSAKEALRHPWITRDKPTDQINENMIMSLNNLAKFEAKNKIKDAIMTFIVTQLSSSQDIKDAKEAFRMLDQNGDGKLSRLELLNGYKSVNLDPEVIDKIMARVDTDSNGYIDYTEFLKAAIDIKKLASNINLKIAFETFDKDGSGKISPDELRYALLGENEGEDSIWGQLIEEVDQNGDGEIDIIEFTDIILKKF